MAKSKLGERLGTMKPFLIVLVCTIAVWMGAAMSEEQDYPTTYHVEWRGLDTSRFVVVRADTAVDVVLRSNGFHALSRSLGEGYRHLVIDVSKSMPAQHGSKFVIRMDTRYAVQRSNQRNDIGGISTVGSRREQLELVLAERRYKRFKPQLIGVAYNFAPQYGLGGDALVTPDSVTLYGSQESLDKITRVATMPIVIANIDHSGKHSIDLNPAIWQDFPDLYPSTEQVEVYIPVRRFAEKTIEMPVRVVGLDAPMKVKLYPDNVQVQMLVPTDDYSTIRTSDFQVLASYSDTLRNGSMRVRLARFPSYARIVSVSPHEVRFVVIK